MLSDEVGRGVRLVADIASLRTEDVERVANAISAEALSDLQGRRALAFHQTSETLIYFSIFKAVTAAASVLGAAAGISAAPFALPAVLSAIGALGALHGLAKSLPIASAQIASLLLSREDRAMTRDELWATFGAQYVGPQGEMKADFEDGLDKLEEIKSIRIERGTVRLIDRVLIRL